MRNVLHIFYSCFILFLLVGCNKHEAMLYEGASNIHFFRGKGGFGQQDSVKHSFFLVPDNKMRDTVYVDVRTMGKPSNIARSAKIVQTNIGKPGAAEPGTHYVAFDSPEMENLMFVPAGAVQLMLPVIFLRDPSMDTTIFRLEMSVASNEYFTPGVKPERDFMLQITALPEQPLNWDKAWKNPFGVWGPEKMKFIIRYVGFSDFEYSDANFDFFNYLKMKSQTKLLEYNKINPEYRLCEDKGKLHPSGLPCTKCVVFPK